MQIPSSLLYINDVTNMSRFQNKNREMCKQKSSNDK